MRTKNAKAITADEREYLAWLKDQPCIVCNELGPSHAHHIEQGNHYMTLPLCDDCHVGPLLGIHGQRRAWAIRKLDEQKALGMLMRRLFLAARAAA